MKIKRLTKAIISIFLIPIILTGCYNYREINIATFATSIIFDTDDIGNVIIYMDCVKPYRNTNESSENGRRILYKGQGKTALEAIRNINAAASYKINLTQNRAIIFTTNAARKGIGKFLSLLNNDQECQVKPYLFVYDGSVEELLDVVVGDEEYLGLYLNDLVQRNKANPRVVTSNINDYLSESQIGSNYAVVGSIDIRKDVVDQRVELSGGVLLKDNIFKENISTIEGLSYNILMNKIKTGTLEVPNPQSDGGVITLEILKSSTKTDIEYDRGRVILKKDIKIKAAIAESQGRFIINNESINELKRYEEGRVKMYLNNFFSKYNRKNIDILGIERVMDIKYPNLVLKNVLSITDLDVNVDLDIEGSNKIENTVF